MANERRIQLSAAEAEKLDEISREIDRLNALAVEYIKSTLQVRGIDIEQMGSGFRIEEGAIVIDSPLDGDSISNSE